MRSNFYQSKIYETVLKKGGFTLNDQIKPIVIFLLRVTKSVQNNISIWLIFIFPLEFYDIEILRKKHEYGGLRFPE